ncbi:MAG: hypothetical protein J7M38_10545 [Armatimonadetes bacterium]|nr:hypothetical protein [Armatimonadota bacterium]
MSRLRNNIGLTEGGTDLCLCMAFVLVLCAGRTALPDEGPSVAIVLQGDFEITLTGDEPPAYPSVDNEVRKLRDCISRQLIDCSNHRLIEHAVQQILDTEIATRLERGEQLDNVLKEVGARYQIDYYLVITFFSVECDYSAGILGVGKRSKGWCEVRGSWIFVPTGETTIKPAAHVQYRRSNVAPQGWLQEVVPIAAKQVFEQIVPPDAAVIHVMALEPDNHLVILDKGLSFGLHQGLRVSIREPTDETTGLPGERMCYGRITDRIGRTAAACKVELKNKKPREEFFRRAQELIDAGTPPEVTLQ